MQEGGTGILLPWLPFLSSQDAPDHFRLGDHTEGEMAMQEPLSSAALELKAPLGLQPRLTDSSLFPERVWTEHRWTLKIPDCPDLRQRNRTAPNNSEHNLCSLPRARIKALQGEHFLGTSVPLQGSEVSLCTPQMRETSLVDQREALERETGLGTLLL